MKKRIIWAIDAFRETPEADQRAYDFIRQYDRKGDCEIIPTFVLSPDQLGISEELSPPWADRYQPLAQKSLADRLGKLAIPGMLSPRVLIQQKASLRRSAATLLAFAAAESAELIAVSSHGRHGLSRVVLGSFAESLLLQTPIPTFVTGPENRANRAVDVASENILFATDLLEDSGTVWNSVLHLAEQIGAGITLLHAVPNPIEAVIQGGVYLIGGGWVPLPAYYESEEKRRRENAQKWIDQAASRGIAARLQIDRGGPGVLDSILKHSNDHRLVALAGRQGGISGLAAALVGSLVRELVRHSHCPVWVCPLRD